MDERVNDFLNEIDEIAPPVKQNTHSAIECIWKECFDDKSGYTYYWNMNTNAVTWEMPDEFQEWLNAYKIAATKTTGQQHQQAKPLFPSVSEIAITTKSINGSSEIKKLRNLPDYLIESDQDSSESATQNGSTLNSPRRSNTSKNNSDNEGPEAVCKTTLGFSLLAGYGSGSDEDEEAEEEKKEELNQLQASSESKPAESHVSTLFPATKPIDVNQFKPDSEISNAYEVDNDEIDTKAFKRKRRIGVHLDNRPKIEAKSLSESQDAVKKMFAMSFVKGDTLQPNSDESKQCESLTSEEENTNIELESELQEQQTILKEKLNFLSEGRDDVVPVQIMSIQLETLYQAWKAKSLKSTYLSEWITSTCNDLVKLEEVATPEGWTLEWDRMEKRYFYRNKKSNDCQWDYPQGCSEETRKSDGSEHDLDENDDADDDAMDISPPPSNGAHSAIGIEVISITASATDETCSKSGTIKKCEKAKDWTDLNSALDSFYSDIAAIETAANVENTQLDTKTTQINANNVQQTEICGDISEPPKKKKKVKMSHGIAMKKKGVSQLVEKWKNVQKDLE